MTWTIYAILFISITIISIITFYTSAFKVVLLKDSEGEGRLFGQLRYGASCALLPNPIGYIHI